MYYDVYREGALDDIEFVDASKKKNIQHINYLQAKINKLP